MDIPGRQSLSALLARQPKFHFWLLSSLGVVVLASSFLSHDKRGLLYYDAPTALLADDLAMMPDYITGGFGGRLATGRDGLGERPNRLLRTIAPRGTEPSAAGAAGGAPAAPGGAIAPSAPGFTGPVGPALASAPGTGGSSAGLPAFGSSGGFAPTPIGFVPAPTDGGSSSGGGTSGGDGGSTSGGSSSGGGTPGPVVPAVPEPASWLMMIIAVFTLGSAIRRGSADRETLATC